MVSQDEKWLIYEYMACNIEAVASITPPTITELISIQ
jgi:hypothetical protein